MTKTENNKHTKFQKEKILDMEYNILLEQSCAYSVIFKSYCSWELERLKTHLRFPKKGFIIIMSIEHESENELARMESECFYKEVYQLVKEIQDNVLHTCVGPLIQNRMGIICSFDENETTNEMKRLVAEKLLHKFQKKFHMHLMLGVGSVYDMKEIHSSYIEAMRCLRHNKRDGIIESEELKNYIEFDYHSYQECEDKLIAYLKRGEVMAIDFFVEMLYMLRQVSITDRRSKVFEVLIITNRCAKNVDIFQNDTMRYFGQLQSLGEDDIDIWAITQFSNIVKSLENENQNQMYGMIQVARKYIEDHYTEDITLEDIARYVSVSPQYFSKLFKEKTGSTYIDYITNVRVMKANELVKHSNRPIQEICYMVGYKDPNYFSRIFKKNMGVTPSQYRKTFTT